MPNDGLGPRLSAKLRGLTGLLLVACGLVAGFAPVMDNVDLGWHIAQGRWMAQHLAFYSHDAFNYPNLGHPVIDEYPLFQLVLVAAWSLGWWGPCLLTSLLLAALLLVLMRAAKDADPFLQARLLAALGMMLLLLHIGSLLRPHLVSYLCLAILGTFLLRHRDARSWTEFWPVALLQIAWTNSHSAFVIGPALVGLFGAEVCARRWWRERTFPRSAVLTWLGAFAFVLLACLVNPYGVARFQPPFVQEHLESIRAYVGEMEPLPAGSVHAFMLFLLAFAGWFILSRPQWRGLSLAFIAFAAFFFHEALDARKAWPIFGVMLPLIVLSETAFAAPRKIAPGLGQLVANFVLASCSAAALAATWMEIPGEWRQLAAGHSELPYDAVYWMKAHRLKGRIFHRCEDGGLLQMKGFDDGVTFADTGFGKYDGAFIHEVGLVNERPALVPRYLAAYKPDFVVCGNWCYQWPYYLRQAGWRLVFYTPNSMVWTPVDTHLDLPTVTDAEIKAAFDQDIRANGVPSQIALFGRNIIALNSLGLGDFAFDKLTRQSPDFKKQPWFWEAARWLCFSDPPISPVLRDDLIYQSESGDKMPGSYQFRGYAAYAQGDSDRAIKLLASVAPDKLTDPAAEALLKLELERNDSAALPLARRTDCWDLRNGRHWEFLAEAEEKWGTLNAARAAWKKAVFYYPDDDELMKAAADFAAKHNDAELKKAIADSGRIYGVR